MIQRRFVDGTGGLRAGGRAALLIPRVWPVPDGGVAGTDHPELGRGKILNNIHV
jgi:hypothetical protein